LCGIVGYIGVKEAAPILLDGLRKLEYRGYDSAGIAIYDHGILHVMKAKGRLKNLEERVTEHPIPGTVGIGHTRWATHGEPSDVNSHPQTNQSGDIAVVHNGIIENYLHLREWLTDKGYHFVSDTDTECIAHLVNHYYEGNLLQAVRNTLRRLDGSYALGVICRSNPEELIAARKDSPLVIGLGDGENYIASDIPAILAHTRNFYLLEDKEIAVVRRDNMDLCNEEGEPVEKEPFHIDWDVAAAEKGGYEHFMIKEIHEQPQGLKATLYPRLTEDQRALNLNEAGLDEAYVKKIGKVYIIACGTAYHAGVVGKNLIEHLAGIPVETDIASEFRYRNPIIRENDLVIVISQSGETADTLAALRLAKKMGARILSITNVVGSTASREAHQVMYTWAGPEIAVASTKAYTTQLMSMYLIALELGHKLGRISREDYIKFVEVLKRVPYQVDRILDSKSDIQRYANHQFNAKNIFFIGRGLDYALAMEGSLKLKEVSYIHSEAYPAGELKHGTIALIEEGTLVVAIATQENLFDKMLSNIKEVKARGAVVMALVMEGNTEIEKAADLIITIPRTLPAVAPILSAVPLQLFAYYVAVEKGCDVDKPRNLAKSVTVE
jgi:glucosamine--fructose-6-phosphate aminotransferase (isomerizing)